MNGLRSPGASGSWRSSTGRRSQLCGKWASSGVAGLQTTPLDDKALGLVEGELCRISVLGGGLSLRPGDEAPKQTMQAHGQHTPRKQTQSMEFSREPKA